MAVTKAQMAQWSRNYEGKYKDKKNEDSYHPAQTEPATKEQMNRWEENYQKKQNEANSASNRMAQSRSGSGVRTAVESPLQTRVQLPQGSTDTRWMSGGTRQLGTLDSKKLADEVLDIVLGTATGSPVKTDRQEDYEPDWNYAGGDNTAKERAIAQGTYGWYAKQAQGLKDSFAPDSQPDRFDQLNQWMDADTRHRELVTLIRSGKGNVTYAQRSNAMQPQSASGAMGSAAAPVQQTKRQEYTDAELMEKGYSQQEINEARAYIMDYDAIPLAQRAVRRTANTIGGIVDTVAAALPMTGELAVQGAKDIKATARQESQLRKELEGDARGKELYRLLTDVDMDYKPQYTDEDILQQGYTQEEIDTMRGRIAGTVQKTAIDPDASVGYQLYKRGQDLTAAAQAGMTPAARTAMGIASSAAENLAVAGISPYLVLPVLSAQGAAESMGQSVEKNESAGQTLATGLAKFGAGWAINSVGAADLARSMGADYAKDTLAGQIADWVRGLGGDSAFKQNYPAVAAALSGGMDNAVQAFAETYADTAIDAVLGGDTEAAEALLKPETFVTALQSGLTGGASGALGGAVGTGLGAMSKRLEYKANGADAAAPVQGTAERQVQREEAPSSLQSGDAGAATELPLGGRLSQRNETAVDDDPAKHTPAQNARIAEYKDSADLKLAEYVDRVRAGEQPAPYMVTETSDRMRDAMQQLTGLDKVGSVTMMDANAVRHITNRHGGGDGSADATMKESTDVARAGYVLDNFDNAYLATRKAEGYFTSNGKRAPIVIFEKKKDGSHVIVEAVTDTKKSRNYIVSEYLSSVGVPEKEIAKALRPPMDAAESDPRHTSETLNAVTSAIPIAEGLRSPVSAVADPEAHVRNVVADPSAGTTVPQRDGQVNVEKAGESVETVQPVQAGEADTTQSGTLRETYGLRQQSLTEKQRSVQRELSRWKVSRGASETISRMVPDSITDLDRYTSAASCMYRLGQMEGVKTFDKALELAGSTSGLAGFTNYVLQQPGGKEALQAAWTQGQGETEAAGGLGGALSSQSTSGEGRVIWKGSLRTADEMATRLIQLNAAGTGTDAILQSVLRGPDGAPSKLAKACVDTETAQIYFGDRSEDVFGTILHEDFHWYNALDAEGAKALMDMALEYMAESAGYEKVDSMIRDKMQDYAAQNLTYEQAAEELVAESWSGIFETVEDVTRWAQFQRAQADKNAGKAGTITKAVNAVKQLLNSIISKAKEILNKDPENRAALHAKNLAQAQKKALQDAYFAHAEKAMDNLRAAKENAAAIESNGAAKGVRFEIRKDAAGETYIQIDDDILKGVPRENWKSVVKQAIKERFPDGFMRNGWTILNSKEGRKEYVWSKYTKALQWENGTAYADKMRMAANLDEIIATADEVYREPANHKNAEAFNRGKIRVKVGENAYEADVLTAIKPDTREIFYDIVDLVQTKIETFGKAHMESEDSGSRGSKVSNKSIAQDAGESKENNAAVQKTVRFALAQQADREAKGSDQRQASRAIADKAAALDTLGQFFGLTRGVKVSRDSMEGLAVRWTRTNGSRADRTKLANEAQVLVEYLKAEGADMGKAQALAETLAGEVLDGATYRNSELWDEYPELHKLEYTVNKTGAAKAELVRRYGSWGAAVAEARRHGVTLRQAEGVRDGNPAEQYESIVNDVSAAGYVRDGARALWRSAAEQAGVDGALSMESTEWLDVLMNLHDAIKPKMMSRFADVAEYEDARVELAGRMLGDVMNVPEMTDAEAIFEGIMQHNMQVARAAAGTEERAAEVSRELKGIQKGQKALFRERLAQNQRDAGQHAEVQKAKANAKAEKQLNDILETQGVDITNLGDLNEKMTVLRESYERQWKEEAKRLKAERQEMLDEAKLEVKRLRSEKNELAWQLRQETRRADTAEYSLIVQENEIAEWEAESERKREAFAERQAQRNALAIEAARQQRDEGIAVAKALAEKRVKKAREGREMDKVRKSVQRNAAALNQLVLRPSPGKYVQQGLIVQAAEVAKLANQAVLNDRAVNRLTALQDSINRSMGTDSAPTAMTEDWKKSGVPVLIQTLREDMTAAKEARLAKLREQLAEAEALPESEKAEMLRDRLKARIRDTENRTYLPLTLEQMRMLNAITSSTLHVIRTANKTLSLAKAEEVDKIAVTAAGEVQDSKGNHPGGALDGLHNLLTKYNLDMLGAERVFRMIGGYAKDGQMEKLARMLNDGQRRQTEITIEGEKKFSNVTGKEHLKEMAEFAGPGAKLVDIGLVDSKGEAVPLTHAQLCSLYMHLQNKDSVEHLMTGGMVLPDAKLYSAGDIEQAYQKGQTVQLGMLKDAQGNPMPDSVLNTVEAALTDYDRAWIEDMKEFFGSYTTNLINETSMQLLGYNRAQVKNYYPIAVDKGVLATQIEGLNLDATIEGRGFLKNRVKSSKPILLEECSSVVQRSLRDTAAYAGLALPIRDVQKVLNSNVETADGLGNLKNKIIKEQWGKGTVDYINDLLTDLQTTQRRRDNGVSRMAARLRGNYAGAVLTLNPGVAIAQAASLPTAGAVLGMDTMAAVVPFVKNLSAKQRAALEAEITQHGDALLEWRKRGSQRGELASIGKDGSLAEKAMDRLPKALTGWINGMDEITVAALWEGSKAYVKNHPAEFSAEAAKAGSEEYWKAVNETYQKVIERTQPNYTVMQRAGIQRNPDEFVKAFTMFTTQRFQNYGILADAVMDYKTQSARYKAQQSAENREQVQRAGKQLNRAVVSQVTQTAVFALMKIGADFLLHRWDREQDENGDVTLESMLKRFTALFTESAAGNFLFGSELYSAVDNAVSGKDYDVVSATNISAVNDLMGDVTKWVAEWRRDTSGMTEAQLAAHEDRLHTRTFNLIEDGMEIAGVPYGNGRKLVDAVQGYWDDIQTVARGGKFSFNALPESATGQYDRLYEAYANGDTGEAQATMEKLGAMGKESEVYSQLKRRLVQYDPDVLEAAQARNNGNDARREQLTRQIIREMYEIMGIDQRAKADAAKREAVIDMVTGAVEQKGDTLLKGDSKKVTDALEQALESVRAKDAQEELDRLLRAGKSLSSVKSKITAVCKPEYVAGNEYDRTQLDEMLLALRDADNNPLYTQKTLDGWVSDAEKKSKAQTSDPWADLR